MLRFEVRVSIDKQRSRIRSIDCGTEGNKGAGSQDIVYIKRLSVVVCQVKNEFQAKEVLLFPYLTKVVELSNDIEHYMITHISREQNMKDDSLAKLASFENAQLMGLVSIEVLPTLSIEQIDIDWILESRKKMSHE